MSLLAEAAALTTRQGGKCGVGLLEQTLESADRAEFLDAIASSVDATALSRALELRGHEVGANTTQRHRRGDCKCPR